MPVTSKPLVFLKEDFVTYFKLKKVKVIYDRGDTLVWETVSTSDASVRRAVKHIRSVDSDGRAINRRVIATELAALRQVNHPHIIETFAAAYCRGYVAYSMPMYPRGSLARLRGKIEQDMLERCFVQVACAVRYLHKRNIVHGDIKPENIMIDDSNNAVLSDFGLAQFLFKGNTTVSEWGGTEGYIGPEVYRQKQYNAYLVSKITLTSATKATTRKNNNKKIQPTTKTKNTFYNNNNNSTQIATTILTNSTK